MRKYCRKWLKAQLAVRPIHFYLAHGFGQALPLFVKRIWPGKLSEQSMIDHDAGT